MRAVTILAVVLSVVWNAESVRLRRLGLGEPKGYIHPKDLPPDEWFEQKLDHFDPTNNITWQQRYFTNNTFWRTKTNSPVFLMIGGEGEASPKWMVKGAWLDYANTYGALCFQLEHRFYGKSWPTPDMSTENLKYLNSEQALADLAYFIQGMNAKYGLRSNKWIVFGGSYPGSLAAWARLKYPHLIHAAVSSSGPLLAKSDFREYTNVVKSSLESVSKKCAAAVHDASTTVDALLDNEEGMVKMNSAFKLCTPLEATNSVNDIANLVQSITGIFDDVVQYNRDNRFTKGPFSGIVIEDLCDIMTNASIGQPFDRLVEINNLALSLQNQTCVDYSYEKSIKDMQKVEWDHDAAERQWVYQTCTEFGFYQTSEAEEDLFGRNMPLKFFIDTCADVYGEEFTENLLNAGIQRSNTIYGALDIKVSRVVFVHGSIDPWHALGITQSNNKRAPAIFIKGTAHCANMYPPSPKDPPQLRAARKSISSLIGSWLAEDD